jgi:DNA-binding transcriptional LysR family regulator
MTARHIADIRYGLYASPDYLHSAGTPKHPRDLVNHDCIRMVCPHWDETWTLAGPGEVMQVNVKTRVSANNIALVRRFAILGAGVAPLDQLLGGEDVKAGRLIPVLPEWKFHRIPVFALLPAKLLPAKTRIFVEFLVARMRKLVAEVD